MHAKYAVTLAAVGNFIGVTAGDLTGLLCLLDAIYDAVTDGTVAHDDYIIIYTDSGAVWDYVVIGIRPPGDYLTAVRSRDSGCCQCDLLPWRGPETLRVPRSTLPWNRRGAY